MTHVLQGKNQCGQACVAMLLDISLEDAIIRVGKKGKTSLRHLWPLLSDRYTTDKVRLQRISEVDSIDTGILKIIWSNNRSHWVVKFGKDVFDPALTAKHNAKDYEGWVRSLDGKITSGLQLTQKP